MAGQRVLLGYNSSYRMFHANALKSATMVTDQTGTVVEDELFYPWGQKWYDVGSHTGYRFFAGMKQQDWKTGNDPALHRDYNPGLGRWLTPDPGGRNVVHLDNPQTWNMYAYVTNNPTSDNDPSGEACFFGYTILGSYFGGRCAGDSPPPVPRPPSPPHGALETLAGAQIGYDKGVPAMTTGTAKYIKKVLNAAQVKSVKISATTNGKHAKQSWHYKGKAIDIHVVNGMRVIFYSTNASEKAAVDAIQAAANDKRNGVAHENFGPAGLFKDGHQLIDSVLQKQHENHIHITIPDPEGN